MVQFAIPDSLVGSGGVRFRAVHTKSPWRKVNTHTSIDSAIRGPNGVFTLFAGKNRIDYGRLGPATHALVWQAGAQNGLIAVRTADPTPKIIIAPAPALSDVDHAFEHGGGSVALIDNLIATISQGTP